MQGYKAYTTFRLKLTCVFYHGSIKTYCFVSRARFPIVGRQRQLGDIQKIQKTGKLAGRSWGVGLQISFRTQRAGVYSADSLLELRLEVRAGETCICSTPATPSFCACHSTVGNPVSSERDTCLKEYYKYKSVGRNKTDVQVNMWGITIVIEESLYLRVMDQNFKGKPVSEAFFFFSGSTCSRWKFSLHCSMLCIFYMTVSVRYNQTNRVVFSCIMSIKT